MSLDTPVFEWLKFRVNWATYIAAVTIGWKASRTPSCRPLSVPGRCRSRRPLRMTVSFAGHFAAPQNGLALSRGRRGSAGRSRCAYWRCQQSWWVLVEVGSVVMGELAAWVAAAWKGREGATAARPGLIACSSVAGWTSPQVPASPELSVLTAYRSSFWVLAFWVAALARSPPSVARVEAWKFWLSGVPYSALGR